MRTYVGGVVASANRKTNCPLSDDTSKSASVTSHEYSPSDSRSIFSNRRFFSSEFSSWNRMKFVKKMIQISRNLDIRQYELLLHEISFYLAHHLVCSDKFHFRPCTIWQRTLWYSIRIHKKGQQIVLHRRPAHAQSPPLMLKTLRRNSYKSNKSSLEIDTNSRICNNKTEKNNKMYRFIFGWIWELQFTRVKHGMKRFLQLICYFALNFIKKCVANSYILRLASGYVYLFLLIIFQTPKTMFLLHLDIAITGNTENFH